MYIVHNALLSPIVGQSYCLRNDQLMVDYNRILPVRALKTFFLLSCASGQERLCDVPLQQALYKFVIAIYCRMNVSF